MPAAFLDSKKNRPDASYIKEAKALTEEGSIYRQRVDLIEKEFSPAMERSQRLAKLKAIPTTIDVPSFGAGDFTLDGKLDQAVWAKSPVLKLLDRNYSIAAPATHVRLGWTEKEILISFSCFEPNIGKLVESVKVKDQENGQIWNETPLKYSYLPPNPKKATTTT